jgi:thiamine-monophosphate kinase
VRRAGARPGDRIVVTGTIGDAALGLVLRKDKGGEGWPLDAEMRAHLRGRYLVPQPRNAIAEALRLHAHAAIDVSDGLAGDLAKLCRASGVGADIGVENVPLSAAARRALEAEPQLIETILTGGDDFEVVAAVAPDRIEGLRAAAHAASLDIAEIGTVTAEPLGARFRTAGRRALAFERPSYSHF